METINPDCGWIGWVNNALFLAEDLTEDLRKNAGRRVLRLNKEPSIHAVEAYSGEEFTVNVVEIRSHLCESPIRDFSYSLRQYRVTLRCF